MDININILNIKLAILALSIGTMLGAEALAAETNKTDSNSVSSKPPVFAKVGDITITQNDFNRAYNAASRTRFYHGKPPEAEVAVLLREIGDKLITNALLLIEAKRLNLKPDDAMVKQKIEAYDQKYSSEAGWQKVRQNALPILTKRYQEENLVSQLEQQVRKVRSPNENQLKTYYKDHMDKFTEPEQIRVSVLLLKVDPAVPTWDVTREKAKELVKQLREGANFEELVKIYSGDVQTINQGGDMGYLHGGMLSEMSQQEVDKLKPGEISDPVGLMEGIAIFKLTDRKEAKLNSFEDVRERARELYLIDEGERAWKALLAKLRNETPIALDESRYLPLPAK